jgi:hypothetical protein
VRLDHLLSKEHLATTDSSGNRGLGARIGRVCRWGAQLAETLVRIGSATAIGPRTASGLAFGSVLGCGSGWWCGWFGVPDILLGPEGTSACDGVAGFGSSGPVWPSVAKLLHDVSLWSGFRRGGCCGVCGGWVGVRGWPLFENCTVDASIFVVKLPRANGECLGTRSR